MKEKTEDIPTGDGKYIVSAPIIMKPFFSKRGETRYKEFYIERTTHDYFIKFCPDNISRKELEKHLSSIKGKIKVVTLEVEFYNGNGPLDFCYYDIINSIPPQSRMGKYVIIHRIIKD